MTRIITFFVLYALLAGQVRAQIGFGTASPNSSLDVRGATAFGVLIFSANQTADIGHHTFLFNGTTAVTLTLPDATTCKGRVYSFKNISTTLPTPVVTIQPAASQKIDSYNNAFLDEPYELARFASDGSNWITFLENVPARVSGIVSNAWFQGGNNQTAEKNLGTLTNSDMAFITANNERMRVNTSGFLGIETTPETRFHLVNDNDDNGNNYILDDYGTSNTGGFFVRKAGGTVAAPANLESGDLITQWRFSGRNNNQLNRSEGSGIDGYYLGSGTTNLTDLRFVTSNTERMRINPSGYTAIGTSSFSSSAERLVIDAGNTASYNVISGKGSLDNYLQLNIRNSSGGTNASSDIVATANNGDESVNFIDMGINSGGYTNVTYPNISGINTAYLYSTGRDFVIGNGTSGKDLVLFTNGYTAASERLRILANGNIGIGVSAPSSKLAVAGIVSPSADNTYSLGKASARWTQVWATTGTVQTSDERLKTDIKTYDVNLNKMLELNPVQYHWKDNIAGPVKVGLLAQQVRQLVPEAIAEDKQADILGINYSQMVPVLIGMLHKQQQKLAELTALLEQLEKQQP